ncbi:hypothetical protein N7508_006161 [Penicillium antarcticum]|uniref:uncharacterized protein n=1 Tax=Penicillium antarcticum TaxID=416450 RepID=UPI00238B60D3|nr:uncharacterized protein N7508_006161 [Penicillium antarcticum]KAJ5301298.1 hypothetical protein N7508_006161 [Penicillium antarcticum]
MFEIGVGLYSLPDFLQASLAQPQSAMSPQHWEICGAKKQEARHSERRTSSWPYIRRSNNDAAKSWLALDCIHPRNRGRIRVHLDLLLSARGIPVGPAEAQNKDASRRDK